MKMQHIRAFVLTAKYQNLKRAAADLQITPSALSKHVKALEEELNVQLFIRNPRKVMLTPEGRELLYYAQSIDDTYGEMRRELKKHARYQSRPLVVRCIYIMQHYGLADMFSAFGQKSPQILMSIAERPSLDVLYDVTNYNADLGFVFKEMLPPAKFNVTPLYEDSFSVLLNRQHPCAGRVSVALPEVEHSNVIIMSRDSLVYQYVVDRYRLLTHRDSIFNSNMRLATIIQYIKFLADYIAILPSSMANLYCDPDVVSVPLDGFSTATLVMITRKEPYPESARQFMEYAENYYRTNFR